ncbi:MAG TPA: TonB-dependent receptor [Candidatus Elarobacter sp.]|nr:TonB-dependent receptor [Candidatus Elarobacter sp.]
MALALAFSLCSMHPALAQSTAGSISGTVTSASGPVGGVAVTAVSPANHYQTTTNAQGFYSIVGVVPDTYAVTFTTGGYVPYAAAGITVGIGQNVNVSQELSKQLQAIGRTQSRSTSSAFQPQQTTDTYNVNTQQIDTITGKANATNEITLLLALPGASLDNGGYPVLRGGRENEEGYQYEGISYTDPFTNQFVNSLFLHGESQFQLTPGAGDASNGNAGTGAINLVAKRGTYPTFGSAEFDFYTPQTEHTVNVEYGWATPNGRFSSYTSFLGDRSESFQYGPAGTPALLLNDLTGRANQWANDFIENAVYKFGKDNNQSFQVFYNNTQFDLHFGNGFTTGPNGLGLNGQPLYYKDNDPFYLYEITHTLPFTVAQVQELMPFTIGQKNLTQEIGSRYPENDNQPNDTFKLQYTWNVNPSTFVTAKYYEVNNVELFDNPYIPEGIAFGDEVSLQGGFTRGLAIDGTKQLGSKHLLGFGAEYKFLHPVFSQPTATGGFYEYGGGGAGFEAADFLSPTDPACPLGPGGCGYLLGNNPTGTVYVPPGTRVPYGNESAQTQRQDWALYVQDTFSPTDRIKIDAGLRLDGANWMYGACNIDTCLPTATGTLAGGAPNPAADQFNYDESTRRPRVLQPRLAIVDQLGRNDSVRVAYARSMQFPLISYVDHTNNDTALYAPYTNVPSFVNFTGSPATFCGTTNDRPCKSYADQLYWENELDDTGIPIQPLRPIQFNNYEMSYSHNFSGNLAIKATPFYRKAYNEIAQSAVPVVRNGQVVTDAFGAPEFGPSVFTNLGHSQITGAELYLTKIATYGFSGELSLTYQNEFTNVLPTSPNENFYPSIPPAALQLGNLYRVGFLSPFVGTLAVSYKTHGGWRINPTIFYNKGYPMGSGLISAYTVNGVPYNLPNTNVTNSPQLSGPQGAPQYVDPVNPGSVFAPNIAATRGTPEGNSPGGVLSKASFTPQLSIEYSPPNHPRNTIGILVTNLFNNYYGAPAINSLYQPVATGHGGPYSGYTSLAVNPAFIGPYNYTLLNGNLPYIYGPIGLPRTAEVYYQLTF